MIKYVYNFRPYKMKARGQQEVKVNNRKERKKQENSKARETILYKNPRNSSSNPILIVKYRKADTTWYRRER